MNCAVKFQDLLVSGPVHVDQAMAFFDELEPVDVPFMLGSWRGKGFPTHHRMDGLMENFNWYGKIFESSEDVHPLVFQRRNGDIVRLNPLWFPMKYAGRSRVSMSAVGRLMFDLGTRLLQTRKSRARLRMTEYRGKVSATMVYDQKAINDVFRRVDENTVLGVMDLKAENYRPFFFVLERATA